MKPLLFLLMSAFLINSMALAANLQDESYFYKVSKALRGTPPTQDERLAFETAAAQGHADSFIQAKIQEYTKTPQFTVKLKQKVDELFRMNAKPNLRPSDPQAANNYYHEIPQSSYDNFISNVISQNQSWDQLLLGKTYQYPKNGDQNVSEQNFFNIALKATNLPDPTIETMLAPQDHSGGSYSAPKELESVQFPAGDGRVAGVITTPRFFARYANTALNKNRRRASTVFRIFLCDTMVPSVPVHDDKTESGNFDLVFPDHKGLTEDQIRSTMKVDVHGQMPDCRACHYKLDPMGQTFGYSAATLAPMPSTGALAFKGADNRAVNIPVTGLGELAQKITEQPEYATCQVQHFWNWYVGKDVPMSRNRKAELVQKFNSLGRKTQDFVSYLVSTPEFRQRSEALTEDQMLARGAAQIMQNCVGCHQNQDDNMEMKEWDLTDLPYSDDPQWRNYAIDKLSYVLDVKGDGSHRKMPPRSSMWKLNSDDYQTLKKWIAHGAPDFQGKPQVEPTKESTP